MNVILRRSIVGCLFAIPVFVLVVGLLLYFSWPKISRALAQAGMTIPNLEAEEDVLPAVEKNTDAITELREIWKPYPKNTKAFQGGVLVKTFDREIDWLEETAQQLWETEERWVDGSWKLGTFYDCYSEYDSINQVNPERYYSDLLEILTAWRAKYPESAGPWLALASLHIEMAWHARGSGFAHTVTEEGWQNFAHHMKMAEETLADAPEITRTNPEFYTRAMAVGLGRSMPVPEMMNLFRKAQELAPTHTDYYSNVSHFLTPRWHGHKHRDWHDWLVSALRPLEPDVADEIYARTVLIRLSHYLDEPMDMYIVCGVDFQRTQRGIKLLLENYPEATYFRDGYLKLAFEAQDHAAMAEALDLMERRYVPSSWKGKADSQFFRLLIWMEEQGIENVR